MNKNAIAMAVAAVVFAAVGLWQYQQRNELQLELDGLKSAHDKMNRDDIAQIEGLNKQVADLQKELRDTQSQLALNKAEQVGAPVGSSKATVTAANGANPQGAMIRTIASQLLASPDTRVAMAEQAVNAQYGALFAKLKLPPDKEKALKQKLQAVVSKQLDMSMKAAAGEIPREEVASAAEGARKEVDAIMAEALDAQQMAEYKAYQADAPARQRAQVENATKMQLSIQAPGLTEPSKAAVSAALAQAMSNPAKYRGSNGQVDMVKMNDDVEISLQQVLPEDQMRIAREFLRQRSKLNTLIIQQ